MVPSIGRALTLLEFLAQSRRGYSISEISRKLALPVSSTHLILTTLERRGYLRKNPQTAKYSFGLKLLGLSRSALENLDLREEAKPLLQSLMQKTGLTVHLCVLERGEAVVVEKIECPGLVKLATWVGKRSDAHCTGVGKALIAFLPEDEFDQHIGAKGLAKHNHNTIVSIRDLKRELAQVRELGYSVDDEENEIGLRCVGAPIFGENQQVLASISVAGITSQVPIDRIPALASMVKQTAGAISTRLGFVKASGALANKKG